MNEIFARAGYIIVCFLTLFDQVFNRKRFIYQFEVKSVSMNPYLYSVEKIQFRLFIKRFEVFEIRNMNVYN